MMKYIRTERVDGRHEIFVFPKSVDHDVMMEGLSRLKDKTDGNWERIHRTAVTAGFVHSSGECYGKSYTLNIESSPKEDTALLKQQQEQS